MADDGATWGERDSDFELEVSSLDAPRETAPSAGSVGRVARDTAGSDAALGRDISWDAHDGDVGGDVDGEAPWSQPLSPRRKLLAATTAAPVGGVALLVVLSKPP